MRVFSLFFTFESFTFHLQRWLGNNFFQRTIEIITNILFQLFKAQNIDITPEASTFGYIINGTCGANEKNLSISTLFADNKPASGLSAADLTK